MTPGNFNSANLNSVNFRTEAATASPADNFNPANLRDINFSYGVIGTFHLPFGNFQKANFIANNFRNEYWNFRTSSFNSANFRVESATVPLGNLRGRNFSSANFRTEGNGGGGATIVVVASNFPMDYIGTGKAKELRSKFS